MKIFSIFIFLFLSFNVYAFDFKGVEIGAVVNDEELNEKFGTTCNENNGEGFSCLGSTTIVGDNASVFVKMSKEREVQVVLVTFDNKSSDDVKKALIEKFNKPKRVDRSVVQNAMGAQFNQEICYWENSLATMKLDRYAKKLTQGSLMLVSKKYEKKFIDTKSKKIKDI